MNEDYEFHYTVVYNPALKEFRVVDGLGFPSDEPVWNGAFWERVNDETEEIDRNALVMLGKLLKGEK